ncbi:MAG: hypothetical protein WC584_02160 [Candidatus Pacearchaeota archaeon]
MKLEKGVLVCSFLLMILLGVVSANSCGVKPISQCTGIWNHIVFEMSSDGNAHVQSPNAVSDYQYAFCCDYPGDTTCTASNKIIRMYSLTSSATNSHAEIPDRTSPIYTIDACYTDLSCSSVNAGVACPTGKTELLSLSADTNAHAGIQGAYTGANAKKICCNAVEIPQPCTLTEAKWMKSGTEITSPISEGDTVSLYLTGTAACSGKSVNFKISKVGGGDIDTINGIVFSGSTITTNWIVKYLEAGVDNLNYVFRATLIQDSTYKDSGSLAVKKGVCGDNIIQTNRGEDCDPPSLICDASCHYVSSITSCSDYESIDICNGNPRNVGIYAGNNWEDYQDFCQRRTNGTGCLWNSEGVVGEKCTQKTEYQYHPDNPEVCVEIHPSCSYTESIVGGNCDSQDIITINYVLNTQQSVGNCTQTYSRDVPCPETSMLPFFGFYQVIISSIIISIIYGFLIVKRKIQSSI